MPNYRGDLKDAMALVGGDALRSAGLDIQSIVVRGVAAIDRARNDLLSMAHHLGADYALCQDDDVKTEPGSVREMVHLCETYGFDVLAAPVQMRGSGAPNFGPDGPPMAMEDGSLVGRLIWTGLGSVLVSKRAMSTLIEAHKARHYRPRPDTSASLARFGVVKPQCWNVFGSDTVPASELDPDDASGEQELLNDDHIFSYRLRQCGIVLRVYLNAVTDHAGMGRYCAAERMGKR